MIRRDFVKQHPWAPAWFPAWRLPPPRPARPSLRPSERQLGEEKPPHPLLQRQPARPGLSLRAAHVQAPVPSAGGRVGGHFGGGGLSGPGRRSNRLSRHQGQRSVGRSGGQVDPCRLPPRRAERAGGSWTRASIRWGSAANEPMPRGCCSTPPCCSIRASAATPSRGMCAPPTIALRTDTWKSEPEGDLPKFPGKTNQDFKHEEVRRERFALIEEVARNYPIDGLELQLNYISPGPFFFHPNEVAAGRSIMTAWLKRVYEALKADDPDRETGLARP